MCVPPGLAQDERQCTQLLAAAAAYLSGGNAPLHYEVVTVDGEFVVGSVRVPNAAELDADVATLNLVSCLTQHAGGGMPQLIKTLGSRNHCGQLTNLFNADTGLLQLHRGKADGHVVVSVAPGCAVDADFIGRIKPSLNQFFNFGWPELCTTVLMAVLPHCQWHPGSIEPRDNGLVADIYSLCVSLVLQYPAALEDEGAASELVCVLTNLGPAPNRHRELLIGRYGELAERLADLHPALAATLIEHMRVRDYEGPVSISAWKSIFECAVRLGRTDLAEHAINTLANMGEAGQAAVDHCKRILVHIAFPSALESGERATLKELGFTFKIRHTAGGLLAFVPDEGVRFDPIAHGEMLFAFVYDLVQAADDAQTSAVALTAVEFLLANRASLRANHKDGVFLLAGNLRQQFEAAISARPARVDLHLMVLRYLQLLEVDLLASLLNRVKVKAQGGTGSEGSALQLARWLRSNGTTLLSGIPNEQFEQMFTSVCTKLFSMEAMRARGNVEVALAELKDVSGWMLKVLDRLFSDVLWDQLEGAAQPLFRFWSVLGGADHLPCHATRLRHAATNNRGTLEQWLEIRALVDQALKVTEAPGFDSASITIGVRDALLDTFPVVVQNSLGQTFFADVVEWAGECIDRCETDLRVVLSSAVNSAPQAWLEIARLTIVIACGDVDGIVKGFNACVAGKGWHAEGRCDRAFVSAIQSRCRSGNLEVAVQLYVLRRQLIVSAAQPLGTVAVLQMVGSVAESLRQDARGAESVLVALLGELFASNPNLAIATLNSILNTSTSSRTSPARQFTVGQTHPMLAPRVCVAFARYLVAKGQRAEAVEMILMASGSLHPDEAEDAQEMFNEFLDDVENADSQDDEDDEQPPQNPGPQ